MGQLERGGSLWRKVWSVSSEVGFGLGWVGSAGVGLCLRLTEAQKGVCAFRSLCPALKDTGPLQPFKSHLPSPLGRSAPPHPAPARCLCWDGAVSLPWTMTAVFVNGGGLVNPHCARWGRRESEESGCQTELAKEDEEGEPRQLTPFEKLTQDMSQDEKVVREITLGKRIGFYRIRGEIGSGNFSQVKLGIHSLTKGRSWPLWVMSRVWGPGLGGGLGAWGQGSRWAALLSTC